MQRRSLVFANQDEHMEDGASRNRGPRVAAPLALSNVGTTLYRLHYQFLIEIPYA